MVEKKLTEIRIHYMDSNDTSDESRQVLADIYHRMPLDTKVKRIFCAYQMGKRLAFAGLKQSHGQLDECQLWYLWAKRHLGTKLFKAVYGTVIDE